mmetsp:Transcript_82669/g.267591  ORF Transcript_82669/g.267591 Transcript_82669/m.267591 type:complete len:226 (-) Transcript_82669:302-979(-)
MAHLPEVGAHGVVGLDDVCAEDAGSAQRLGALHAVLCCIAPAECCNGLEEHLNAQVIAALAADVGHGVQVRDATHEAPLFLAVLREALQGAAVGVAGLEELQPLLVRHGLDHEPAGLLLDGDEFRDVAVLEAGPGKVQGHERVAQLRARGPCSGTCLPRSMAPALKQGDELQPGTLQRLGAAHGLGTELKLVAVHPDGGILLDARLQHVHAVVACAAGEEQAVAG